MVSKYFNLGEDEIDDAIASLNNMLFIKKVEQSIGCIEYLKSLYKYIPTRRDFDTESYNGVEESPIGILVLDAIFTEDGYKIDDVLTDIDEEEKTIEELEIMDYEFRTPKQYRLDYKDIENIGVHPKILTLNSENISKALKIAESIKFQYDNNIIINKIKKLADFCTFGMSDIVEGSLIDLNNYRIDLLFSEISLFEIEIASENLLELEEYCRDIVRRYS